MINNIYNYKYINAAATTQVVSDACTLGRVNIPATLVGTLDIYDATSGTSPTVAHFPVGTIAGCYQFDVTLAKGLRVVTSSASDFVTLTFKTH